MTNDEVVQKAFDIIYSGLRAQGWKRSGGAWSGMKEDDQDFMCKYSDDGGRRCAVGQLVPPGTLSEFEGCPVESAGIAGLLPRWLCGEDGSLSLMVLVFLKHLQSAHDLNPGPMLMEANFSYVAREYGLTIPEAT